MRPSSLAEVARRRTETGRPLWLALDAFLDAFYAPGAPRAAMLAEEPPSGLAVQEAAYLAGVADYLADVYRLEPAGWTGKPEYFLAQAYWPERRGPAFEAVCAAESPTAFRRRFIFTEGRPLRRKNGPRFAATISPLDQDVV